MKKMFGMNYFAKKTDESIARKRSVLASVSRKVGKAMSKKTLRMPSPFKYKD